jgi:hypothetical protein
MFRYWDGRSWSAGTSVNPQAPPSGPLGSTAPGARASAGFNPYAPIGSAQLVQPGAEPRRRSVLPWILATAAVVLVVAVLAVFVVRGLRGGTIVDQGPVTSASPSAEVCPDAVQPTATPEAQSGNRVTSGLLSYARLGDPFSDPYWDRRVPFGRDVQSQQATVEANSDGTPIWVAAVLIARLLAGDGFYGPEQGAKVVATCVVGKFYDDAEVTRKDTRNEAISVDGHQAWTVEAHLSFQIPKIKTTGETMIIVVVDTGNGEAGLFYASIPDTSPQFMQPARQALASLKVG